MKPYALDKTGSVKDSKATRDKGHRRGLTKNICEVYGQQGYIRTACTYSPYGQVASSGDVEQPIQWSSEFNDTELALIYYNYRHYNPVDGRWMGRDFDQERKDLNDYLFAKNSPSYFTDVKGLWVILVIIFIAGAVVGAYAGIFIENECHVVGEIAEKEVRQKCTRTCKYPSMWACCKNTEKSRVRKAKYICELTLTGKKLKFYKWLDNKKPNPAECAGKNCIDKGVKCSIS
ncbi:MAG: RHS repeat-associated core domain-containing protein [Akkermansia sp.]|nr:RHS repeat-associated core domain-containing protein [Akkermansia sp.]